MAHLLVGRVRNSKIQSHLNNLNFQTMHAWNGSSKKHSVAYAFKIRCKLPLLSKRMFIRYNIHTLQRLTRTLLTNPPWFYTTPEKYIKRFNLVFTKNENNDRCRKAPPVKAFRICMLFLVKKNS